MKRRSLTSDCDNAVNTIGETLRTLGVSNVFPCFTVDDARIATELLRTHVESEHVTCPWQLVPSLVPVLRKWAARKRGPSGVQGVGLPPGLLLLVQSAAVRDVSPDSWYVAGLDDDDGDSGGEDKGGGKRSAKRKTASQKSATATNPTNPMAGKCPDEIAQHLVQVLNEPKFQVSSMKKWAIAFGEDGIWELLQEANKALAEGSPITKTAQGGQRSAGGIFI